MAGIFYAILWFWRAERGYEPTNVFELFAKITLDTSEYSRGLENARNQAQNFSNKLSSSSSGLKNVFKPVTEGYKAVESVGSKALNFVQKGIAGFATAATAVAGFGATSVNAGMQFDAAMSQVSAVSGATGDDFDKLRNKALEMGAKTQFSASEAAEAMNYMAMAGWKTNDMVSGIAGIMNLAAASGEDLATTSDIVTDALTAFGLTAGDSGHFADVMAVAASNANTNVGMMGQTFKYVAPVAGALGYSIDDTALAIGLMANSGIKATQAGTALRSIFTRLSTDAGASSQSLGALGVLTEKLGVEFYNADGSARALNDVLTDSRAAWAGLSEEQQISYAKTIAGQEAMSGWLALMNAAQEDIAKLTSALEDANGAAEKMAATMMDNLTGDVKLFKSALESLQIAVSDTLKPTLREFTQFGTSAMQALLDGLQSGGVDGMMTALTGVVTKMATFLSEKAPIFIEVSGKFVAALAEGILNARTSIMTAANDVLVMFGDGLSSWLSANSSSLIAFGNELLRVLFQGFLTASDIIAENIGQFVPLLANAFALYHEALFTVGLDILGAIGQGIITHKDEIQTIATETIERMTLALIENAPQIIEGGIALLKAIVNAVTQNLPLITAAGAEIIAQLIAGITTASPGVQAIIATAVIPHILKIADTILKIGSTVTSVAGIVGKGITTVLGIGSKLMTGIKALFALLAAHPVVAIIAAIIAAVVLLWNNCEGFRNFVIGMLAKIKEAFAAFGDWLGEKIEAIKEFFGSLRESIEEKFSAIGEWFREKFTEAMEAVKSAWEGAKEFFAGVWQGIQDVFSNVGEVLGNIFHVALEIIKAKWDSAVEFFSGIWEGIKKVFSTVKEVLSGFFKDAWEAIKESWSYAKEFYSDLWNNIKEKAADAGESIKTKLKDAWDGIKSTWDSAKTFFGDTFGSIMDKGRETAENIGNKLASAYDYIKEHWDEATPYFSGLWGNIKNVFGDAWNAFKSIGGNIVNGIKDGIGSAWNRFMNWLGGKVGGIVSAVKNMLGIHSPSTVFAGIGENMALGLKEGWDDEYKDIKRRIESDLNFGAASIGLSANGAYNAARNAQSGPETGLNGAGGTTVIINSPVAVDAIQAAREWKKTTQRMAMGYV